MLPIGEQITTGPSADARQLGELRVAMERSARQYIVLDDPSLLRAIAADGCDKARKFAQETMRDVREAMGLAYN